MPRLATINTEAERVLATKAETAISGLGKFETVVHTAPGINTSREQWDDCARQLGGRPINSS